MSEGGDNSEKDRAEQNIAHKLRALASNIMRVTRGAGEQFHLEYQAQEFFVAIQEYRKVAGRYEQQPRNLASALHHSRVDRIRNWEKINAYEKAKAYAEEIIIRGALQIAASRLAGQLSQENAGHNEMYRGMRELREAKNERDVHIDGGRISEDLSRSADQIAMQPLRDISELRKRSPQAIKDKAAKDRSAFNERSRKRAEKKCR